MELLNTKCYNNKKYQQGYITLLGILLVTAIGVVVSTSIILLGIDLSKTSSVTLDGAQARQAANACAEHALMQIYDNNSYTGTDSITLPVGSCSYSVINTGGNTREIDSTGIHNNVTLRVKTTISALAPKILISSWVEVDSF